ncbi:hypothetical protein BDR22DRAFT_963277 [Usnea florida]
MPNATDIITYIGVPLAVLGVMPLLWNMVKSFIIRYRLQYRWQYSFPKDARKHYSFIMDPAAGTVTVGVDAPQLEFGNILRSSLWRSNQSFPFGRGFLYNREKDLMIEPWMGFESVGIHPSYTGTRKRFTVGYDLRVESVNLACSWQVLVILSLALGVDPYRGGLLDLKRKLSTNFGEISLKSSDRKSIINVRKLQDRVLAHVVKPSSQYSVCLGMAWDCTMVEACGTDVHVVPLSMPRFQRLLHDPEFHATHRLHLEFHEGPWPTGMARALVWVIYAETYYHEFASLFDRVLPVTQEILKIREDILEELKLVDNLEASLNEVFLSEDSLVHSILAALGHEWATQVEDKRKSRPYTEDPPGYVDIWDKLQDNDTFKALKNNYHPVPSLRTRSDADLTQPTTPMAVLARVIIAVSSIQKWPREEWSVEIDENGKASFTVPADPMDELLGRPGVYPSFFEMENPIDSIYLE